MKAGSDDFNKSLANLVVLRGKNVSAADLSAFCDPTLYTSWLPVDTAFAAFSSQRQFHGYEKSAVLLSNSQSAALPCLDRTVDRAWQMFASRAYVHQYIRHGLVDADFVDCFATLEQVIANYRQL